MTNLPVDDNLKSTFYVDSIKTINSALFSGLDDRTVYDFYITAINDFIKYNYYMPDAEVVKLSIKTKKDVSKDIILLRETDFVLVNISMKKNAIIDYFCYYFL